MNIQTRYVYFKEINLLKKFIKKNYKKNHPIVKSRSILKFYFINKNKKKINFIGTFKDNSLISILGIINNQKWDKNLKKDIQLSLWVNIGKKNLYGLSTLIFILNKFKPKSLFTSGLKNLSASRAYQIFGKIYDYNHYYISNPILKKKISKNLKNLKYTFSKNGIKKIIVTKNVNSLPKYPYYPKKSIFFFRNKFEKNPFYKYFFLNFFYKERLKFFLVCRKIEVKKLQSSVLRVVDFYGEFPINLSFKNEILDFLIKNKIEYLDFLVFGINHTNLVKQGFLLKKRNQIIPNYFEPFLKKNIDNKIAVIKNPYNKKLVSVKADSDQEQPQFIK